MEENDSKLKAAIEQNDAHLKTALDDNDQKIKAALEKLEKHDVEVRQSVNQELSSVRSEVRKIG